MSRPAIHCVKTQSLVFHVFVFVEESHIVMVLRHWRQLLIIVSPDESRIFSGLTSVVPVAITQTSFNGFHSNVVHTCIWVKTEPYFKVT